MTGPGSDEVLKAKTQVQPAGLGAMHSGLARIRLECCGDLIQFVELWHCFTSRRTYNLPTLTTVSCATFFINLMALNEREVL